MQKQTKLLSRRTRKAKLVRLPGEFSWLKELDMTEQADFISGLLARFSAGDRTNDWSQISEWIGEWKATANIYARDGVMRGVKEGMREMKEDDAIDWSRLRVELGL